MHSNVPFFFTTSPTCYYDCQKEPPIFNNDWHLTENSFELFNYSPLPAAHVTPRDLLWGPQEPDSSLPPSPATPQCARSTSVESPFFSLTDNLHEEPLPIVCTEVEHMNVLVNLSQNFLPRLATALQDLSISQHLPQWGRLTRDQTGGFLQWQSMRSNIGLLSFSLAHVVQCSNLLTGCCWEILLRFNDRSFSCPIDLFFLNSAWINSQSYKWNMKEG